MTREPASDRSPDFTWPIIVMLLALWASEGLRAGESALSVLSRAVLLAGVVALVVFRWIARRSGWVPPGRLDVTDWFGLGLAIVFAGAGILAHLADRPMSVVGLHVAFAVFFFLIVSVGVLWQSSTVNEAEPGS